MPESLGLVDVAIVGGGASGLAVAIQLIDRIKKGYKEIKSIMIIEKREIVGPGLAYSDNSDGLIVNMHADTMGLCPVNQLHFTEWVQENTNSTRPPFPSRQLYGQYLAKLAQEVVNDAKKLGVNFHVITGEVVNIESFADDPLFADFTVARFDVFLDNGDSVYAKDVVLALGNFYATANPELRGNPKYFRCPWPAEKMEAIDRDADVLVIGSRLTAIDVANALVSNGHTGSITFISRSGKLPRVQGKNRGHPFAKRYMLNNLARELELTLNGSGAAQVFLTSIVRSLVHEDGPEELPQLTREGSACEILREDVKDARASPIKRQIIAGTTAPLVERYWNTFTIREKERCLSHVNSTWVAHRHSMPRENGEKMLKLLETGQLRVVKGSKVDWDEAKQRFELVQQDGKGECIEGDFLIESLGQEFDTAKIDSRLLHTLLSSGCLRAHPICGLDVDFDTLKAPSGLHVIGSLTKGVHFYVTATDRVTAHASRIADSLVGFAPSKPVHIAFFVGSDLFSHLMLSKVIPALVTLGHCPFIFLPKDSGYKRPNNWCKKAKVTPYKLQELSFWERTVLQDTLIPTLGSKVPQGAMFKTITQMAHQYGLLVHSVPSFNSPAFLQTLKDNHIDNHIDIGISLRCYQRFKKDIISYFNTKNRCLLNLHPGKLPEYRGVITAFRAMSNGDKDFGYSLHHVDENFDAGAVIAVRTGKINYDKSMLAGMHDLYQIGVGMVMDAVEGFSRGADMHEGCVEQDPDKAGYYTFPTQAELAAASEKGVELLICDGDDIRELLLDCFAGDDKSYREVLDEKICSAFSKWKVEVEECQGEVDEEWSWM